MSAGMIRGLVRNLETAFHDDLPRKLYESFEDSAHWAASVNQHQARISGTSAQDVSVVLTQAFEQLRPVQAPFTAEMIGKSVVHKILRTMTSLFKRLQSTVARTGTH